MLNGIKSMILEKENYMEAAQLIFEDAAHGGIDDLIVLNEKADVPEDDEDIKDPEVGDEGEDLDNDDDKKDKGSGEDDDITNILLDDEEPLKDGDNPDVIGDPKPEENDLLATSIDDEIQPSLEPTDDLPPVGNDTDDLLNISIDLRSNTIADVLPVPPDNAGEAISDDILSTRVDSGFEESASHADKKSYEIKTLLTVDEFHNICRAIAPEVLWLKSTPLSKIKTALDKVEPMLDRKDKVSTKLSESELAKALKTMSSMDIPDDAGDSINTSMTKIDDAEMKKEMVRYEKMIRKLKVIYDDINSQLGKCKSSNGKSMSESSDDIPDARFLSFNEETEPTSPAPVQSSDPAGAAAGFPMDENKDDILNESIDNEPKKEDPKESPIKESIDNFFEAITLDGGSEEKPADGTEPAATAPESTPEDPGDPPVEEPVEGGEENEVTAAVKDKVAEADAPIEGGDSTSTSKEALLKKLGSISKGLEDAKKAIIDTIK